MNTLTKYGVMPRTKNGVATKETLTALLHTERRKYEPVQFFNSASNLLDDLEKVVRNEIIPELETYYGRWHPSGFMVYQLGDHKELGTLRLHIWPKNLRQRHIKGAGELGEIFDGDIHNHAWLIASRTLCYYQDNIYGVKKISSKLTQEEINQKQYFRVFNVEYHENVSQGLIPNGDIVEATIESKREAGAGDTLTIIPGVFHAPTIPLDRLGATLVMDSYRVSDGPDILVRGTTDPIYDTRQQITAQEAILAKTQVMETY